MERAGFTGFFAAALFLAPVGGQGASEKIFDSGNFFSGQTSDTEVEAGYLTLAGLWGSASSPMPARYHAGFAFDEARGKAVVFGGHDQNDLKFDDTWVYDPSSGWTEHVPAGGPAARYGHGLVWAGDKFLLFGGLDASGGYLNDTWMYDVVQDTWTFVASPDAPEARAFFAMAYDADQDKVVLFGGEGVEGITVNAHTWVFDVAASSWSRWSPTPSPGVRMGSCMAYDRSARRIILFGGRRNGWEFSEIYGDTWALDVSGMGWEQKSPSSPPGPRSEAALLYDARHGQTVLFGGRDAVATYLGDIRFYHFGKDRWQEFDREVGAPPGRYGHGMAYDTVRQRGMLFAGRRDVSSNLLRYYTFASTGTWTSPRVDSWESFPAGLPAPIRWGGLSAVVEGSTVSFQLASSTDGVTFNDFSGPDGSSQTFYVASAAAQTIWAGHGDRRFLLLRSSFSVEDVPARPWASQFKIVFNRAPFRPTLLSPADRSRLNDDTPVFAWNPVADQDGDTALRYQFQADDDPGFASPDISRDGLADASFSTTTLLTEGTWYWRVRGRDEAGLYGDWSSPFQLLLDTHTPPSPVTQLAAAMGAANGSVVLSWIFPGDDKGRVDNGLCRVRYSVSGPILTEPDWQAAAERTFNFSADPAQALQTAVSGLSDAATYYFAVKTEDEVGNLSALSSVSPVAFTNAPPHVALVYPNGGAFVTQIATIVWIASDPNPAGTFSVSVSLSPDGGQGFPALLASLPMGTTSFLWDSRSVSNGTAYRVKVQAVDQGGFVSSAVSDGDFRVDNVNEPPVASFLAPLNGQPVSGDFAVRWRALDPNTFNTHTFNLYFSTHTGAGFIPLVLNTSATTYVLRTREWPNKAGYRLMLEATDSGEPPLGHTVVTPEFAVHNSNPPRPFRLLRPLADDDPAVFDVSFAWEAGVDPDGDAVFYTLRYSTDPALAGAAVVDLRDPLYTPPLGSLAMDTTYYWRVTARDVYSAETDSAVENFRLFRHKAKSPDRLLSVETVSGRPPDGYLFFEDARVSQGELIQRANRDSLGDRLLRTIRSPAWNVQVRDLSGRVLPSDDVESRLVFRYSASPSAARGAPVLEADYVKIVSLNGPQGRWELIPRQEAAGSGEARGSVRGFSVFSLVASPSVLAPLSSVTNFPNPFAAGRETTRIRYALTEDAHVTLRIYTLWGDLVREYEAEKGAPGGVGTAVGYTNEVLWDGRNGRDEVVADGMYLAEIRAESSSGARREIRRIGVVK
ncbi:MAG TPA: kelch repeat-containing protein [Elusimicrobiota bacterium]|nr:kelch repeat-containing protein [Elusimicrobiota bacterium]